MPCILSPSLYLFRLGSAACRLRSSAFRAPFRWFLARPLDAWPFFVVVGAFRLSIFFATYDCLCLLFLLHTRVAFSEKKRFEPPASLRRSSESPSLTLSHRLREVPRSDARRVALTTSRSRARRGTATSRRPDDTGEDKGTPRRFVLFKVQRARRDATSCPGRLATVEYAEQRMPLRRTESPRGTGPPILDPCSCSPQSRSSRLASVDPRPALQRLRMCSRRAIDARPRGDQLPVRLDTLDVPVPVPFGALLPERLDQEARAASAARSCSRGLIELECAVPATVRSG